MSRVLFNTLWVTLSSKFIELAVKSDMNEKRKNERWKGDEVNLAWEMRW